MRPRAAHSERPCEGGFTLIELLVSLMILTLIISFIPGALRIGQRVWEVDRIAEDRAALSAFRRYVEQRIAEAMPIHRRERGGAVRVEFAGGPDSMVFVAPAAAGPAGGGVYRFELRRDEGQGREQPLLLRQSLYRFGAVPDSADTSMEHRSRAGVTDFALRYFGAATPQEPPQWHGQWSRQDRLPDLVEMSLARSGPREGTVRSLVQLRLNDAP